MGEVKVDIVVPSLNRYENILTKKAVSNLILCVPEYQEQEYKEYNPECKIVTHPDDLLGITKKRQWILEHYPNVFMIDDDIKSINRMYVESGEPYSLTPDEAYWIIQYIANCANMAGAYLFGMNKSAKPTHYNEMKPIFMNGQIEGGIGILDGGGLFFHEKATVSEDYWISGYNAYLNRYSWIDNRFSIVGKETFTNSGGLASIRNLSEERENTIWLREMFGEAITAKKDTNDATRKHQHQRTLSIPY